MKHLLDREPALILGAVQSAVALAVSFGLDLSAEQVGAIVAATSAVLSVVVRRKVFSPESVNRVADESYLSGVYDGGAPR